MHIIRAPEPSKIFFTTDSVGESLPSPSSLLFSFDMCKLRKLKEQNGTLVKLFQMSLTWTTFNTILHQNSDITRNVIRTSLLTYTGVCGRTGGGFSKCKVSTLIVLIFRSLSLSTANTTARCHTSKTRGLTSCKFFSGIFYFNHRTLSISLYSR